ncbi:uncharacterized protein LOC121856243 isoform X2 [Homarus americanus]|nr:uncharacterized protein LOC121856243 isoform X2 [Homarus americanus]XP_042207554.1 uncharacterized protein LOC121856243 isoform X2 [Homarus americanus]XP_042207555.1 uncharacterized protein LOC121856243 isoform X2 [Homarus americanus]XP_042207556.1 uncharacterized protein LOC121856243 isoform X2 [Homarus americanus]
MAESDHETLTSESGMRKFFRGILPHWPDSSPQGGATPVHNETLDTGNGEFHFTDNTRLKRKSSLLREKDESEDSDYEENLPSCKRQRITVAAMSRLFAKFSLCDGEHSNDVPPGDKSEDTSTTNSNLDEKLAIPAQTSQPDPSSSGNTEEKDVSTAHSNNNDEDIPNMNNKVSEFKKVKRDNKPADLDDPPVGKRRKTGDVASEREENDERLPEKSDAPSEDAGKNNKRQVEVNESDNDEDKERSSKVKRTRRLRRGLRLCTNITCYIEQVLYN